MSGSKVCSQISWPKYYQEEKLGVSSVMAMEQSRLYSEDGFAFAASLPSSLLLASSTLARTIVDPGREGLDIVITSIRSSTLLMVSELLRTGLTKVVCTKGTINEVKDLMEMLGIPANLDVVGNKVVPVSINNQEKNKLQEVGALGRDHPSSMVHDFSQVFELSSESEEYSDSSTKEDEFVLDILEVSSETEDEYASEDEDKNNNELQEVHDEWKTDYQQPVGNQSVEGGVPIEGISGCESSLERKTHECSATYPSAVILPKPIVPSDSLWQGSKEDFLSMFGLCTHAQAEQIRARSAAVSAGRSKIRIRRSRKGKNNK